MIGWLRALWPDRCLRVNPRVELAKLGDALHAERRRNERLHVANEGLRLELKSCNRTRLDDQAQLRQAEDRIAEALQVLANRQLSAQANVQARLILAGDPIQLLPDGEASDG